MQKRLVAVGIVATFLAIIAALFFKFRPLGGADDEAPVRVRNGSVQIFAAYDGTAKAPNYLATWALGCYPDDPGNTRKDCWVHQSKAAGDDSNQTERLWVRVFGDTASTYCNGVTAADANQVEFDTDDGRTVAFKRAQKSANDYFRIQVQRAAGFLPKEGMNEVLEYRGSLDASIVEVRTKGSTHGKNMECRRFAPHDKSLKIVVCASEQVCENETEEK